MRQVFISYSSKEADQANRIVQALESQGIECWIAPRDIGIGSNYTKDIPSAIRECAYFLLALSRESQASKWVNKELTRAINQEKHILPLMIEDFAVSEGFEFLLEDVQTRRYFAAREQILREVTDEIHRMTGTVPPVMPTAPELSPEEMYAKGDACYEAQNYTDAVEWYRKAAEQGYAIAQYNLGYCYQFGNGVARNYETAVLWYRKAAEQGHANAQNNLGVCYRNGYGVPRDDKTGVMWYQKAAEQGHANAQNNLGVCYRNGYGVPRDDKTGAMWYRKAAEQGYANAQHNLGFCYQYGTGVKKNLTEAKKWYQKAADQGLEEAKKALKTLK